MKGLLLCGGNGTRLQPATFVTNKHLLNILNKPMVLYPLETLKSFGIKDIMVVTGGNHVGGFAEFLGDGSEFGVNLTYRVQKEAGGIAEALGLAEDFVGGDHVMVILGDNVFGNISGSFFDWGEILNDYAYLLVKYISGASRFGVLIGSGWKKEDHYKIVEKPKDIDIGDVVTGLYLYPPSVFDIIKTLQPSERGELEITDVNNYYLENNKCVICRIDKFWSDAGTPESLMETIKWAYKNH